GAQSGHMQRFDQRKANITVEACPVDGPHPVEQVPHLLGRVVEELRDDVDRSRRLHDGDDEHQVQREAQQALAGGVSRPLRGIGSEALRVHASSPATACGRRSLRRNKSLNDALSSRMARTMRASTSPSMMIAMMVSRMVQTKS